MYTERDTGSWGWKSVRTPLFRPAKYCMQLIFTCLNITTEALRGVCASLAEGETTRQLNSATTQVNENPYETFPPCKGTVRGLV